MTSSKDSTADCSSYSIPAPDLSIDSNVSIPRSNGASSNDKDRPLLMDAQHVLPWVGVERGRRESVSLLRTPPQSFRGKEVEQVRCYVIRGEVLCNTGEVLCNKGEVLCNNYNKRTLI